ncbi:MAG: hypothetical protein R6U61_05270 [Thermoplasmata archaeon]
MNKFREFDREKDGNSIARIWKETGWLREGKEDNMKSFVEGSDRALVAEMNGDAECLVVDWKGDMRYLDEELPFSCVSSVTTSRIARKQGFAAKLTALAVAQDATEGAAVSGLGMFEQGFYNRLGFGTGSYENWVSFDPGTLDIDIKPRIPSRLGKDDWKKIHEGRLNRMRGHGHTNIFKPDFTRTELSYRKESFGLGYYDEEGELSHHVYINPEKVERGPYWVRWLCYHDREEFLELMSLLKSMADQVRLVGMREPQGIQMQDLLNKPFQYRTITSKSEYENKMRATAYWQVRILDLEECLRKTKLSGEQVRFNLKLKDPIEELLDEESPWRGISGDYIVTLGRDSRAVKGNKSNLPTLKASVGVFTRMWLGVQPATGLHITDELDGPVDLLKELDDVLRVPKPHPDWDF